MRSLAVSLFRAVGTGGGASDLVEADGGGKSTLHGASSLYGSLVWRSRNAKPLSIWLRASLRVVY